MIDVLAAFGLSSSAGFNAYLPLLITGLMARFTDFIVLASPWDALENGAVLGVLAVLTLIEMTADKIPIVDSINDVVQTVVRPVAGAILFAGSTSVVTDMSPGLAMILGLITAGTVHATKAAARPVITASTAGIANPVVSAGEDAVSATTAIVAIIFPVLAAVFVIGIFALLIWLIVRRSKASSGEDVPEAVD